jgi:hypothetical protein
MASTDAHTKVLQILDRLEEELDVEEQGRIRRRHMASARWEPVDRPPVRVMPPWDAPAGSLFPVSEAVTDPAKMLANELQRGQTSPIDWLRVKDDRTLQVRPDLGIGLVASVFGCRVEVVGNNPPWVSAIGGNDIESDVMRVLDDFDPSSCLTKGWIPRAAETLDYFLDTFTSFPKVSQCVAVILPDLQGPFETAGLIWGSSILEALYANPSLVNRLTSVVADAMIQIHDSLRVKIGRELLPAGFSHQHGMMIRGNLLLRCDSNVMLSPSMYAEQILPHDKRVLETIGGGSFHSCGRWKHNIPSILALDAVGSLDFGSNQSQLNDIDDVYRQARSGRKHLHLVTATPGELTSGSIRTRFPTGATLSCEVESVEEGAAIMREFTGQTPAA